MKAWLVRLALALVVGLFFVLGSTDTAHAESNGKYIYWSQNSSCGEVHSSTYATYWGSYLYGQSDVMSTRLDSYFNIPCSWTLIKGPNELAARARLYKYSSYYGYWYVCGDTRWRYNSYESDWSFSTWYYGGYPGGRACGAGWYSTWADGSIWWPSGWYSGSLWSGSGQYFS